MGRCSADCLGHDFTLSTKVGRLLLSDGPAERLDPWQFFGGMPIYRGAGLERPYLDFTYDGVMRSVEASRQRTGIDRFDILFIHDPDLFPDEALDGAYRALDELRTAGTVGAIGCGMGQWQLMARFARETDLDCFLLAGRYTLLDQSALAELLPLCQARGIAVIAGGVFNSGILCHPDPIKALDASRTPDAISTWAGGVTYDYAPAGCEVVERTVQIKAVCERHGIPLMAAALQFPLGHPAIVSVLIGPRSTAQVEQNVALFNTDIPADLWAELKHERLLPEDAPLPG